MRPKAKFCANGPAVVQWVALALVTLICQNLPMCGRYRLSRRKQLVEEYFDTDSGAEDWVPRYNIAPTQPVPVIRQNAKEPVRELSLMRWGLIPSWAKDSSVAASMKTRGRKQPRSPEKFLGLECIISIS